MKGKLFSPVKHIRKKVIHIDGQTGIDDYIHDIYDLNPEVLVTWFPLSSWKNTSNTNACDKTEAVKGFSIQVDKKLFLNGSNVTLNWTLDAGCDVILSWMYTSSSVIQEWFNGIVKSGSKTIYFQSSIKENITVFATNYVLNESNTFPCIESFNVSVEIYSLDDFYVDYKKYVSLITTLQTFVVGVREAVEYYNEDIMLLWNWGDGSGVEKARFTVRQFYHNYAGKGDFEGSLTVTWNEQSRVIPFVFHLGELEYKVSQTMGNIALTRFEFTVIGLARLNPILVHSVKYGDGSVALNTLKDQDVSVFKHVYSEQGIYQVTFEAYSDVYLIESANIGLQIIVDNPITFLVIETNNPVGYPPAILTLNISVPYKHLPVHNMNCMFYMDDFIDWNTYNASAPLVNSETKLMFEYTYLTLGVHNIKISCRTISSLYETSYQITVYNECFSSIGIFDYKYSNETSAMNLGLDFNAEIGCRKDVLCLNETPIYMWSIEKRFLDGYYDLLDKRVGEPDDFQIKADQFNEGLYRLNLNISFPSSQKGWYQEFTYINGVSLPVRSDVNNVDLIKCLFNCFDRVATRHILHVQCIYPPCRSVTTKLKWTLMIANGNQNINNETLDQITHYGIHNQSLIIRGGSLTPGTEYKIRLSVDAKIIADYSFTANRPPFGGSCEVNPSIGFAGETVYTISCSYWTDDNNYTLYYQYLLRGGDNKTVEQVLYVGSESTSVPLYLPVGDRYDLYQSRIEVRITDSFGDYADVILYVTTFPSKTVQEIKNAESPFGIVSSYINTMRREFDIANFSRENSKIMRHIQSVSSNIALIPLPYQGISLDPDEICFIGFAKDSTGQEVPFDWNKYWRDFLTPPDPRQQVEITKMTSALSGFSFQLCRRIVSTRFARTYTISSLTSTMADIISAPDYVTKEVLMQVLECADQLNTNFAIIAFSSQRNLQNHENITIAAEGMVRLVSKMLKVVQPTLTPYIPQNPTVQVMRNFLQYMETFNDDPKYKNRSILLQEQTFIAMKELRRLELEKERKTIIALTILHGWRKLLTGTAYAIDALSGLNHPEVIFGDGLIVMSTNHWIGRMQQEEIRIADLYLNFSGSILGKDTSGIMNISTVVFMRNPFYWGPFGEKISSRVVEFTFHPSDALLISKVNITIPNEGNLECKYKAPAYTAGGDNTTIKYLYHSFDRQSVEDDVLIFIKPNSTSIVYDIYMKYDDKPTQFENNYTTGVDKSNWTSDGFRVIIRARYLPLKGKVYLAFAPRLDNKTSTTVDAEDPRMSPVCLFVSSVHCRNWDGSVWIYKACQVSAESSLRYTMCMCETNGWSLITGTTFYFPLSFQSFEPPYIKPFFSGTSRVLITMAACIFLYLILLTWAWLTDLTEDDPWQFTFLSDTNETHIYLYLLRIYTGFGPVKGTTANICFKLVGDLTTTGVRTLCDDFRRPHNSGSVRNYVLGVKKPLGNLLFLHIWHDHSGDHNGSWFLRKILVDDLHTDERTIFVCNNWLSLQKGDLNIERKLTASTEKEMNSFGYRLSTNISHYLAYVYIWSSLFVRMHPSKVSRVGRVTEAFVMVMALVVTNLVIPYVDIKAVSEPLILGPFRFSEKTIYSALISICITVPVMYIVFAVLHKSNLDLKCFPPCKCPQERILRFIRNRVQSNYHLKSKDNVAEHILVKRTELPTCIGMTTWMLLLFILSASLSYTIYASTQINVQEAEMWLTSFIIALFVSVLVFEIVMVLLVAILTTICGSLCDPKRAVVNVEGLWLFCKRTYGILQRVKAKIPPSLLPKTRKAVMKLRRKLMLKSQTRLLITEMILYCIFFAVVYVIALSSSDDRAYDLKNQIDSRLKFDELDGQTDFLEWMNTSFFDVYFPAKVFEVQEVPHELKYYFIDFVNVRVGPARLRQVRVKEEPCLYGLFEEDVCFGEYQLTNEDTADYFIGWKDGKTEPKVWGLPTSGTYNKKLYGGGGYIMKLDINRDVSEKIIAELKENKWIDRGTRAVFLEFTLYNSNVNLFAFVKYVREYPEVGDVFCYISLGYLFFGRYVYQYRDPFVVLTTLAQALLGQSTFKDLVTWKPNLAEFYYITFVFLVQFCLLTMATAILNASIALVQRKGTNYEEKGLDDILHKLFGKCMAWVRRRNKVKDIDHSDFLEK
ncbi:hypothetical protein ACJMK2_035254 [Sinanodonta woodiana]|uniref:Uncharacterized protein n=1 Tax=Sinanodonta woodiana TaxID=1069815 RepID=A0ABD3WUX1_SINWO